jgi:hypothetical protein
MKCLFETNKASHFSVLRTSNRSLADMLVVYYINVDVPSGLPHTSADRGKAKGSIRSGCSRGENLGIFVNQWKPTNGKKDQSVRHRQSYLISDIVTSFKAGSICLSHRDAFSIVVSFDIDYILTVCVTYFSGMMSRRQCDVREEDLW